MQRYTQGMMDLGATVCLAKKPLCLVCPLAEACVAKREGSPEKYPVKNAQTQAQLSIPLAAVGAIRSATEICRSISVLAKKRPTPGVWAGLYCFLLFESHAALLDAVPQSLPGRD